MKDDFLQRDTLLGEEGISYLLLISVAEWISSTWMATNLVPYPSKSGFWLKVEFPDDFLVLNQNNPLHFGFHGTQTALIPSIISCCTNNTGFLLLLYHTCFTWAFLQDVVPITGYSDLHLLPLLFKYFNILMECGAIRILPTAEYQTLATNLTSYFLTLCLTSP